MIRLDDVGSLPTTLDGHQVAEVFGVSYWGLLELVKRGDAPVAPLRLGRKLRWSTVAVLAAVGIPLQRDTAGPSKAGDVVTLEDRPRDELDHRAG